MRPLWGARFRADHGQSRSYVFRISPDKRFSIAESSSRGAFRIAAAMPTSRYQSAARSAVSNEKFASRCCKWNNDSSLS
jgi:hypothetical protein